MATPREELADLLKAKRIDAGYESQGSLASKIRVSRPVVSKAENPTQPIPSIPLLTAWAGVTGAPLDKLTDLANRCRSGTPEWFMPYRQAESEATTLRFWGPLLVPGLFQTEDYAWALLSVESYSTEQLREMVAARMERQQVIGQPHITAVIDSRVFRECMGSPEIMAKQCEHLLVMAEHPKIRLHVVPEGSGVGMYGAFALASKNGTTTVNLTTIRDVTSTEPDLVDETMRAFDDILAASMPRAESLDFIRTMAESWKERHELAQGDLQQQRRRKLHRSGRRDAPGASAGHKGQRDRPRPALQPRAMATLHPGDPVAEETAALFYLRPNRNTIAGSTAGGAWSAASTPAQISSR